MKPVVSALSLAMLAACGGGGPRAVGGDAHAGDAGAADAAAPDAPVVDDTPVEIDALGVQGYVLRRGHELVITPSLFTRQSLVEVGLGLPIEADTAAIDAHLAGIPLGELRAVISGHAHYDHLIDAPHILALAPGVPLYTNLTGQHVLAALAPDRGAGCTGDPPSPAIDRARVIALDDPLASHVDYTNCPDQQPPGVPTQGSWVNIPNSHIRLMPLCSMHPAQIAGIYHFGEGSIDSDQCELPSAASGWLEGQTLAYVIDFLDANGQPVFRVYYQDAPTNAPKGYIPAWILAGAPVDVAILNVGSYDAVTDQPTDIIASLQPRYVISGHWEDFFQPVDSPPQPLPLLDLQTYLDRAEAALPGPADAPMVIDGMPTTDRHHLEQPGDQLVFPLRP